MKQQALIIGLGVSGKASAGLLLHRGFSVIAADRNAEILKANPQVQTLLQNGLRLVSDDCSLHLDGISLAILSPGIDPSHPLVKKVREQGIDTIGEIELAFRHLPNRRILGVTGSNGKTTTVLLTAHVLNGAGMKAAALGNVGAALSAYAVRPDPDEILVVELSSFQLETLEAKPRFDAAAILNITPNHLNRHASMEEYAGAKLRIGSCLREEGKLFVSQAVAKEFGTRLQKWEIFDWDPAPVFNASAVRSGAPEWPNIQAARSLVSFYGVGEIEFGRSLKTFRKPAHRIEWVAEISQVTYYNDSKSSNIDAVMHAVRLFKGPIVLIAGGVDKGASYRPWIDCFKGKVKRFVVFGEAAPKMERELAAHFPLDRVGTLQEAIAAAKSRASVGDTVLFSPGCSSYDQFVNYEQRGDAFKRMIKEG